MKYFSVAGRCIRRCTIDLYTVVRITDRRSTSKYASNFITTHVTPADDHFTPSDGWIKFHFGQLIRFCRVEVLGPRVDDLWKREYLALFSSRNPMDHKELVEKCNDMVAELAKTEGSAGFGWDGTRRSLLDDMHAQMC